MNKEFPKITINADGHEISHKFNFIDPSIEDWFDAFNGLLVGITFLPETIDDHIIDRAYEIEEFRNYCKNKQE